MDPSSTISTVKLENKSVSASIPRGAEGDRYSESSSGTQFLKFNILTGRHERISRREYYEESSSDTESVSECRTKPKKRKNIVRGLEREVVCPAISHGEAISTLAFLLKDEVGRSQVERIHSLLDDYIRETVRGFCIRDLPNLVFVIDYLIENNNKNEEFGNRLTALLANASWPVVLAANSDVVNYLEQLTNYYNFLGYILMRIEDDGDFELVHEAACGQLLCPGSPEDGATPLRVRRSVAVHTTLITTAAKMLAFCTSKRFHRFLQLALLMASISPEISVCMVKANIIEHILYRFNPYFPNSHLPEYDVNPKSPHDVDLKRGDSSIHLSSVLSLLLILLYRTKEALAANPELKARLNCPDNDAQRCWIWAFRYECRARERRHERTTLLVVTMALLHCYGDQLQLLANYLMIDILTLAVHTELPVKSGWIQGVSFNTTQADVEFKKLLIYTSVQFLKTFPINAHLHVTRDWVLGLMYLLDPCLYQLRCRWSPPLFAELRKAALQALVCALPSCPPDLTKGYGLIRRTLWYIEWYTVSPFDIGVLYWNVRLLQAAGGARGSLERRAALQDLADTHGLIIIINLCSTLLNQKNPPLEKCQAILAQCLRLLTSAVELQREVRCFVYPLIKWPIAVNWLATRMLDTILQALNRNAIISSRWTIALFNFIWESIVWKKEYRTYFNSNNGMYKILDVISMSREAVQCIGLALVCEAARAGEATAQLVTWRACAGAGLVSGATVSRGAMLPSMLASIVRAECHLYGIKLNRETYVIEDMVTPVKTAIGRQELAELNYADPEKTASARGLICLTAANLAGSRISKAYALLQMLADDLDNKVAIADETYKLYKSVSLSVEDEVILTMVAHYQTSKLGEVWLETSALITAAKVNLLSEDRLILEEFLLLNEGWCKEIKYLQKHIIEEHRKKDIQEESSLYSFLARCRMTSALDALREIRRGVRSADLDYVWKARLHDAVRAHHRRSTAPAHIVDAVIKTYEAPLDAANVIGQNMKVTSIPQEMGSGSVYLPPPSIGWSNTSPPL